MAFKDWPGETRRCDCCGRRRRCTKIGAWWLCVACSTVQAGLRWI